MPTKRCWVARCTFNITSFNFNDKEDTEANKKIQDHVIRFHVKKLGIDTLIDDLGVDTLIPYAIDGFFSDSDEDRLIKRYLDLFPNKEENVIVKTKEEIDDKDDIKVSSINVAKNKHIVEDENTEERRVYLAIQQAIKVDGYLQRLNDTYGTAV